MVAFAVILSAATTTILSSATNNIDVVKNTTTTLFSLGGYLPDYRIENYITGQQERQQQSIDGNGDPYYYPLTDLMLFSLQPHPRGFLGGCCVQDTHYELVSNFRSTVYKNNHKHKYPKKKLNLWITIGGAQRTDAFVDIMGDEKRRQRLIQSIVKQCAKNSIYGIDLDYTPTTKETAQSYYKVFLKEALEEWHSRGFKVSMTIHPNQRLPKYLHRQLDRVHLMAYDMILPGEHHATVEKTNQAIEFLVGHQGLPPEKLILGIPAYGRDVQNPSDVKTFAEIYDGITDTSDTSVTSDQHSWKGYEWDSPMRITEKIHLAKQHGLGGVFFWELGQDKATTEFPEGILVHAAATAAFNDDSHYGDDGSDTSDNKVDEL
jgi:hypothetical protein